MGCRGPTEHAARTRFATADPDHAPRRVAGAASRTAWAGAQDKVVSTRLRIPSAHAPNAQNGVDAVPGCSAAREINKSVVSILNLSLGATDLGPWALAKPGRSYNAAMLDRSCHSPNHRFLNLPMQAGEGVLCLAPHLDDMVQGCAGLLKQSQMQGLRVKSVIVTAAEEGQALTEPRNALVKAVQMLELAWPEHWDFPAHALRHAPPLIARIEQALAEHQPRWLLLPALTEPSPDHQALALAGMAAAQRYHQAHVLFYEVTVPTQINTVVDISGWAQHKSQAVQVLADLAGQPWYWRRSEAIATLRASMVQPPAQAAEGFWQIPLELVQAQQLGASLGGWPLSRNAMGLANVPAQLPLVSVIIRSMNRPTLADAIASVAAQTYPNIEVVVINATGYAHALPNFPAQRLKLSLVDALDEQGQRQRLGRSAAANQGLAAAQGDLLLFLDDDDLLGSTQLEQLVTALLTHSTAAAAYCGVRVEGPDGQWVRDYDLPWQAQRLRGANFLPIHSVLFRRADVKALGAHFDEDLPVLEDWDFWCQLSREKEFIHVAGILAVYRQGHGESHVGDISHENHWAKWHQKILFQHGLAWGMEDQTQTLAWHAVALDQSETQRTLLQEKISELLLQLESAQKNAREATAALQESENEKIRACNELSEGWLAAQTKSQELARDLHASQADAALARRSLQMLQQSRAVRFSTALRSIFKK